jgi:hypothetical protein
MPFESVQAQSLTAQQLPETYRSPFRELFTRPSRFADDVVEAGMHQQTRRARISWIRFLYLLTKQERVAYLNKLTKNFNTVWISCHMVPTRDFL